MKLLAFSVTGLVLPSSVSVPVTSVTLSPLKLNLSATNRAVGNSAAFKKSLLCRCLSKAAVPVLIELVSIVRSTLPVLAALSSVTVPLLRSKRPRLVEVPKWPISKVAKVCVGSIA